MNTRVSRLAPLLLAACFCAMGAGPDSGLAFTNVSIETASKAGRIERGTLILRDGKIEAVGANVAIPANVQVVDGRSKTIMPGIIDPFREVTIATGEAEVGPRTIVIGGRTVTIPGRTGGGGAAFTRIMDNFNPYDPGYKVLLRSGLTGLNLSTSGYGESAFVRVTPASPETMMLVPEAILFTAVANDSSSLDLVRNALDAVDRAKKGMPAAAAPAAPPTSQTPPTPPTGRRGGQGGRFGGGGPRIGGGGSFDPTTMKYWLAIYEGKSPLFASVSNAAGIVHLLKVLDSYKDVKLVLAAPGAAIHETVDLLAGRSVRVILQAGLSIKPNTRDRIDIARLLNDAKIEFAFTQPSSQNDLLSAQDCPLFSIAFLVRCGLPRDVAIKALTARPAAFLGLEKTHGTIEAGKSADVLIFAGDPLEPEGWLEQVLIGGRKVYEN